MAHCKYCGTPMMHTRLYGYLCRNQEHNIRTDEPNYCKRCGSTLDGNWHNMCKKCEDEVKASLDEAKPHKGRAC